MDVFSIPATSENVKRGLILAAAQALCLGPYLSNEIAGVDPAKFVQTARRIFKAQGFAFTDEDLRQIHYLMQREVAKRAARGELPVLDQIRPGGAEFILRPETIKPEVVVTSNQSGERRTATYRKDEPVA